MVRRFTSIYAHTAHLGQHTELTLKGVSKLEYTLRLFVDDEKRKIQTMDNQTWTPAQRPYGCCPHATYTR